MTVRAKIKYKNIYNYMRLYNIGCIKIYIIICGYIISHIIIYIFVYNFIHKYIKSFKVFSYQIKGR
jgi:hypothetical protein